MSLSSTTSNGPPRTDLGQGIIRVWVTARRCYHPPVFATFRRLEEQMRQLIGILALSAVVAAQSPALIEFDAASIKRHLPETQGGSVRTMPDGSLVATNTTLVQVL